MKATATGTVSRLRTRLSSAWRRTEAWRRVGRTIINSPGSMATGRGGKVYGTLVDAGWGAGLGYPALILDPEGSAIDVHVFKSVDLAAHWSRLDNFEGPGYERVVTTVRSPAGDVDAFIYVLAPRDRS
jgi:gamma-glutamylcyclotransferase (GGCT)/AIG2-like uncharacterized protein YtfP